MSESKSKAKPGWYDDPKQADTLRYWDGSAWTEQRKPKPARFPAYTRLFTYWVWTFAFALIGALLFVLGTVGDDDGLEVLAVLGIVLMSVGGVFFQLAIIASGVYIGMQNFAAWKHAHGL